MKMKLFSAIILALLILAGCSSQTDREMYRQFPPYEKKGEYYVKAEYMPEVIGGIEHIEELLRAPRITEKVFGRVYIRAFVNEHGQVDSAHVLKGVHPDCDKEAMRVVRLLKFVPASIDSVNVKAICAVPFVFRIN